MQKSWVPGALTMIFGLLSSLQGVSSNKTVYNCEDLNCPKGFRCCDNECCQEPKIWDQENDPFITAVIILWIMFALLCICALSKGFSLKCRGPQHDTRAADHHTPPEPPSTVPLESIWVTSLNPLPTYSQVVLNSTSTEPPPAYSLRPEGPTGQMRGTRYATL